MALAQTTEDAILAWLLGTTFPAPPAETWLSLHSDESVGLATQISSWSGGDRVRLTNADFGAVSSTGDGGRARVNIRALAFGSHTSDQTVRAFGLWDAASGGNLLLVGGIVPDVTIRAGDPPIFLTGDFELKAL